MTPTEHRFILAVADLHDATIRALDPVTIARRYTAVTTATGALCREHATPRDHVRHLVEVGQGVGAFWAKVRGQA